MTTCVVTCRCYGTCHPPLPGPVVQTVTRPLIDTWQLMEDIADQMSIWRSCGKGTDPIAALGDTSDPDALARLIETNHDYPDADAMGALYNEEML